MDELAVNDLLLLLAWLITPDKAAMRARLPEDRKARLRVMLRLYMRHCNYTEELV